MSLLPWKNESEEEDCNGHHFSEYYPTDKFCVVKGSYLNDEKGLHDRLKLKREYEAHCQHHRCGETTMELRDVGTAPVDEVVEFFGENAIIDET